MAHGILGQSLHGERRYVEVKTFRINLQVNPEAVFIAKLLEGQILAREIVFFRKLDQLAAVFLQCVAQHVAETFDGVLRDVGTELHQRGQRVQSVEQEVRIEAGPDGIKSSSGSQCFSARGKRSSRASGFSSAPRRRRRRRVRRARRP